MHRFGGRDSGASMGLSFARRSIEMQVKLIRRFALVVFVLVSVFTPLAASSSAAAAGLPAAPTAQCKDVVCG